ncbi:MAG: efflux RND transporter periplasmic adaptor subunit [Chitinophagaceae bacterium]|nr:efflux RND transporter periplasmic adaptor subunit [Chitinophagaceae bacterium]MCW5905774.1 efflux RND transporter periplasmic adaptor subunit [Chitinophagaceae bacterium]
MKNIQIVIYTFTLITLFACGKNKQIQNQYAAKPYPVVTVQEKTVTGYMSYPASIQGRVNNDVRAKISGYIKEVLIDEGQAVKKGQILFRLETNALSETAAAAQSGISVADANIKAAEAAVNAAQVEVNRLMPLVQKNIVSKVLLETAQANLQSAISKLEQAKSAKVQAQATYLNATANVAYSIIRSPIDGVVGKLPLRVGSLVGPSDQISLTTVSETDEVYAYFSMNESEYLDFLSETAGYTVAEKLKNIPPVTLILANNKEYEEKGKVKAVTGQIDPQTGSILFRASFSNKRKLLSNGNSGTIKIPKQYQNILVVPEASTFEQQGIVHVFKVDKDTTNSIIIKVIDRVNNMAIVSEGVQKGDTIIASGVNGLKTGTKVIPKPINFDSLINAIKPIF